MKIVIIGFGYVGQAIAASTFDFNPEHKVWVIDTDPDINSEAVKEIGAMCRMGKLSAEEQPNQEEFRLFERGINSNSLFFESNYKFLEHEKDIDAFFICVPDDNVFEVLGRLRRKYLDSNSFVSIESTIDFHHYDSICSSFAKPETYYPNDLSVVEFPFTLVVSPERIMEGELMEKFRCEVKVIGATKVEDYISATNIFMLIGVPQMEYCSPREAIAVKLGELGFRYASIVYAHVLSDLCHLNGCDFQRVRELINTCSSVDDFPYSGIGIGGECLLGAMDKLRKYDGNTRLPNTLIGVERYREATIIQWVSDQIYAVTRKLKPHVLFLGATYRPDGASVRDSPAVELIRQVGLEVEQAWVWDPLMSEIPDGFIDNEGNAVVEVVGEDGLENLDVDVIVLVMPHVAMYHKIEELLEKWPHIGVINLTHDVIPAERSHRVVHRAW